MNLKNNINVFENPQHYRNYLINSNLHKKRKRKKIDGKSLICVFFTSYCGVGCPFCFFHSPSAKKETKEIASRENHFSTEAVDKFIKFANDAKVGYLQISGGGEPFLEFDAILKCIEEVKAERIIIVTSGSWAYDKLNAKKYLKRLYYSTLKNNYNPRVTIRLSISKGHSLKLKEKPLINLINLFEQDYKNIKNFTLQLKTFEEDNTLEKYLKTYFKNYAIDLIEKNGTDDDKYIKVMPWKYKLKLKSGYEIIIGKSRVFNSNLRPNLHDIKSIKSNEKIYDTDLALSQNNFPSIVHNYDETEGLDWIVEYNGNVCTWQNRIQDNLLNIYEDSYSDIYNATMTDLLTYSYIDKGSKYREQIINEISSKTTSLMKAVNIRDYAGTLAFQDEKIRLYYNIRVIQDYLIDNKINISILNKLPKELISAIKLEKTELIKLYKKSKYSILSQELKLPISRENFHDFLELVKLGHYEINNYDKNKAIEIYNSISDKKISSLEDININNDISVERRLTKRMMKRKIIKNENKKTIYYLYRHGETNWNIENRIKGQLEDLKTKFTKRGDKQINKISNLIKDNNVEAIFTSDLYRTKETSKRINKDLKLPLYYYKKFRGLNMGVFQGKSMTEFLNNNEVKKAFIDYNYIIPGGESINQLNERYIDGLNVISDNYNYEKVAIISHGAAISNIKSKISKKTYEDIDYCVIMRYNNKYEVIDFGKYN